MTYPITPTAFDKCFYRPEWYDIDFFYSPDGIKEFPEHHCKLSWLASLPYIKEKRNAIDIGCRDGEYTRYLIRILNTPIVLIRERDAIFPIM